MGNVQPTARIAHLQSLGFTIAQCRAAPACACESVPISSFSALSAVLRRV